MEWGVQNFEKKIPNSGYKSSERAALPISVSSGPSNLPQRMDSLRGYALIQKGGSVRTQMEKLLLII